MSNHAPAANISPARGRGLRAETPIAFIHAILAGYRRYGIDPAGDLARCGIDATLLAQPASRVTALQMERFSELAMRRLDDEALGWFSRRLPWGSYGMLCRASLGAATLGVALKRWCRHHRLLTDDVTLQIDINGAGSRFSIIEHRGLGSVREFCLVTLMRYVHGFACWAIDSRIPLTDVSLPFPRPPHDGVYGFILSGDRRFDAADAGFGFESRYLALPLVRDEPALNQMLRRALPLTVLQYRRDRLLVDRARSELRAQPTLCRDARTLAARLNVSVRTLYRRLAEAGTSLQQLKNDARRERACTLLERGNRPIGRVARDIGFRNEKSFARAFRRWTGQSPRDFRKSAQRNGPPA